LRSRRTWLFIHRGIGLALLVAVVALPYFVHGLGVNYRGPFEGRVVDQDTGQPLEGAVVFVEWVLQRITSPVFFDTKEMLTDKEGKFYIPAEWSWLPWRNFFLYSDMIIFKAGYGHVHVPGAPPDTIKESAKRLERFTPEQRKAMGPKLYYTMRFDDDVPVYLLKKLDTIEERAKNIPWSHPDTPKSRIPLFMDEIVKERSAVGIPDRPGIPGQGTHKMIQPQFKNSGDMVPIH
jgi:hypothetical protein